MSQGNPYKAQNTLPRVVIVGGGCGGIEAARALRDTPVQVILPDRVNHYLFQALLYQVAGGMLDAGDIAFPIREVLQKQRNVIVGGERISSLNVLWMAGVKASPAGQWLSVETDRAGRVKVSPDLTVPGYPEIFVVGDTALVIGKDGKPLPGVAQVAMQGGRCAGRTISRRVTGQPPLPPFKYFDKGNLATIGRNYVILESGKLKLAGFAANLVWAFIHIYCLLQREDRFVVFLKWTFNYIT